MPMITAFLAGLLFGCGLILSGMSNPAKVLAFLDVTGRWDPSLVFVMLGAILVAALACRRPPRAGQRGVRRRLGLGRLLPGSGADQPGRGRLADAAVRGRHDRRHGRV
jgi:hypothetical protein